MGRENEVSKIFIISLAVFLKSKLPVSSGLSRDESRISRYKILVLRDTTLVS